MSEIETRDLALTEVRTDDDAGTFTGLAAGYDNQDQHGTTVRRGAFTASLTDGAVVPIFWEHDHDDPRSIVGEIRSAVETARGLEVTGQLDMDTERGAAAHRAIKGRRIRGLSVGMRPTQRRGQDIVTADLVEVSLVARPSNPRTLVESVRSADTAALQTRSATAAAAFRTVTKGTTMTDTITAERRAELITETRALLDAAESAGRALTETEAATVEAATVAIRSHDESAEERRIDAQTRARSAEIAAAIETRRGAVRRTPSLLVSRDNLRRHAEAIAEGRQFGAIETRAAITVAADMGSEGNWAQATPRDPRHLIGFAGIPVQPLTGATAQVPQFTLPSGAAGVNETTVHPEFDAVSKVDLTAVRHGRWSKVTAAVDAFDELTGLSSMHGIGIARDLDLAAITNIQTAAGSALAFAADIAGNVRLALNTVAANVYANVEDLVIFGKPAAIALLQDVTPASGPDAGSVTARFAGARLYPSLAPTTGVVTVFAPSAFTAFMSQLHSTSQIDPTDGSNKFGSWLHATGVACGLVGGAVGVEVVDPTP